MLNTMVLRPFVYITPHRICNTFTFLQFGVHQFETGPSVSESIRNFRIVPSFKIYTKFQNAVLLSKCRFEFQNRVGTCGPL